MLASLPAWKLAALALLSPASALQILDTFSFGHHTPLSSSKDSVPNWTISGSKDYKPSVLSDKIVLTPPWPSNQRGALWANSPMASSSWSVEVDIRASGPERGSGNLQIWYLKEKSSETSLASIYTVNKFDGLALVLDQYGGSGGSLRGFLNDGALAYRSRHDVDKLAFGHCQFAYRNLGKMSRIKINQGSGGLEVLVEGKTCFKHDKLQLPPNYYLGISAASAENPDSFEVAKFVVIDGGDTNTNTQRDTTSPQGGQMQPPPAFQQHQPFQQQQPPQQQQMSSPPPPASQDLASVFTVLQQLQASIQNLDARIAQQASDITNLANRPASGGSGGGIPPDQINAMARRLESIEKTVEQVKHDIEDRAFIDHLQDVHDRMEDIQHHMQSALPSTNELTKMFQTASPRLGFFLFVILAFQGMLAASYIVYKRRRANSPKKFL